MSRSGRIEGRAPKSDEDDEEEVSAGRGKPEPDARSTTEAPATKSRVRDTAHEQIEPETETGGFVGPFGYRLESPTPIGGIE